MINCYRNKWSGTLEKHWSIHIVFNYLRSLRSVRSIDVSARGYLPDQISARTKSLVLVGCIDYLSVRITVSEKLGSFFTLVSSSYNGVAIAKADNNPHSMMMTQK